MKTAFDIETTGLLEDSLSHKITCIGIKVMDAPIVQFHGEDEKVILKDFMKFLELSQNNELYGWNNIGFDETFVVFRCFINKINVTPYMRIRGKSQDLLILMSGRKFKGFGLDKVIRAMGLDGNGSTGKECIDFYHDKEWDKLLAKNEKDLVDLEVIYKRCVEIDLVNE